MSVLKPLRGAARTAINGGLGFLDLKIVKTIAPHQEYKDYIPFKETIREARAAGLSVGDYVELKHNKPGTTQFTIDGMRALGAFDGRVDRVLEIGPGTGRYLERVLAECRPSSYEIYETARDWARYLTETFPVTPQQADGVRLASTPSRSVDLVHAHKVLPGQASVTACRLFWEMARVVKVGGRVAFDVVTEECFDDDIVTRWVTTGWGYQHYPALMPKAFVVALMERQGLTLNGAFRVTMEPGYTECLVFTRRDDTGPK